MPPTKLSARPAQDKETMVEVLKKSPRKVTIAEGKVRIIVKQRENGAVTTMRSPKNVKLVKDQIIMGGDTDQSRNANILSARTEGI